MLSVTFFHFMAIFLSILALFVMCYMWSYFVQLNPDLNGVIAEMYGDPMAWLTMILCLTTPMCLEMLWRGVKRDLRPSLTDILQERIRLRREQTREKTKKRVHKVLEEDGAELEGGPVPIRAPSGIVSSSAPSSIIDENLTSEDEHKFYARKAHKPKTGESKIAKKHGHAQSFSDGLLSKDETLKRSVIRAMLRFRNITGSTFDSAAQAKYQAHDTMTSYESKERKGVETKEEVVVNNEFEEAEEDETQGNDKDKRKSKEARKSGIIQQTGGDTGFE